MNKYFNLDERPYIELIRYSEMHDRIDHATDYIEEIVSLFMEHQSNYHYLRTIIKTGLKGWKNICRYEIPVVEDEKEYGFLEPKSYGDYLMDKFLGTAENASQYFYIKQDITRIFKILNVKFNDPGDYKTWIQS